MTDDDAPKLIVEVRSGCLDPDDICTVVTSEGANASGEALDEAAETEEESANQLPPQVTREELNLICYNVMIDVLNSQMDLQDIEKHSGLTGNHAADFLAIINKMLSTGENLFLLFFKKEYS